MNTDNKNNKHSNTLLYLCITLMLVLTAIVGYSIYLNINSTNPMQTVKTIGKNTAVNSLIAGVAVGVVSFGHIPGTIGSMAITAISTVLKSVYDVMS